VVLEKDGEDRWIDRVKMQKYYMESRRKEISYINKKKEG
jgi:hypothetical protein